MWPMSWDLHSSIWQVVTMWPMFWDPHSALWQEVAMWPMLLDLHSSLWQVVYMWPMFGDLHSSLWLVVTMCPMFWDLHSSWWQVVTMWPMFWDLHLSLWQAVTMWPMLWDFHSLCTQKSNCRSSQWSKYYIWPFLFLIVQEEFEDTKWVVRIRKRSTNSLQARQKCTWMGFGNRQYTRINNSRESAIKNGQHWKHKTKTNTMPTQTQITLIRHNPSYTQLEVKTNRASLFIRKSYRTSKHGTQNEKTFDWIKCWTSPYATIHKTQ